MRSIIILISCLLICATVFSQRFGGTPSAQKWKQINTDSVRVIYPAGLDSQANRIASVVHWLAAEKPMSLGDRLRKVNIVLQHQTTISNAYVGLGPFRSEFFMTSDPDNFESGSLPWADLLSLHEYRHVQQFNNFHNGLSKLMKTLFGEDGYTLAINAAIPEWFFEGDAVYMETILSPQGRGRLEQFLNAYPSLWQAGKKYSWMKLRNGSLKDYIPNHYFLGYLLVNYGREKYGADFWTRVTRDASAYKSLFYPFQGAIKRHAGIDYRTFRAQAFDFYRSKLKISNGDSLTARIDSPAFVFPVKKSYVKNYFYPYQASPGELIYLKSSYRHLPAFYRKDASGEHKIRTRDISIDNQFSYRNGKIVYAAYRADPRWSWRDYSVIKLLDVKTGEEKAVTRRTKYFTPDISDDGSKIAAVQQDINGRCELHIIDAENGQLLKAIHSMDINLFTDPKFIDDKSLVTSVRLLDGKMALALAEIETGITTRLTTPSFNVVGHPSVNNGIIYFTASYQGNDDVFALRLDNKKIFRISNGPLGNYYVNAANGKITWSVFTAEGYQLKQIGEEDLAWEEIEAASAEKLAPGIEPALAGLYGNILPSRIRDRIFTSGNYKKSTRLLNFHSWRPQYSDPTFTFSIYGQNVLNTLQTELYYLYHTDDKTHAVGFSTTYGRWFPYLAAGTEYTFNRQGLTANRTRTWDQLDSRIGFIIPVTGSGGKTYKNLSIGNHYVLRNEFNKGFFRDSIGHTLFSYLYHTISWIQQVPTAVQHIYPRWASSLVSSYRYAISRYEGYQFFVNATIYVPGLIPSHNLVFSGAMQQRDTNFVLFGSRFAGARGYIDYYGTVAGSRLTRLSADYHLPLLYPDWGFGNILYFDRLRANLFYDQQRFYFNDKKNSTELRSVGAEFYADTKWWNQYPLTFGVRVSRLLDDDPLARVAKGATIFEFLLPVNIIPR